MQTRYANPWILSASPERKMGREGNLAKYRVFVGVPVFLSFCVDMTTKRCAPAAPRASSTLVTIECTYPCCPSLLPTFFRNRNLPQQLTLDHVSPATRLLEKRRQMFEVQEALDAQKEEFQRREATFKRREDMLKKKDLELQESLIRFNKFLQENDSKRNRAEKKRLDEQKQKTSKEAEIEKLKEEVKNQLAKRREMELEVKKMSKYEAFLDTVLEIEDDYPEIPDLLARYLTLDAAHQDLMDRQTQAMQENEEQRVEMQQFVRERSDQILADNNALTDLQEDVEKEHSGARDLLREADRQISTVADSTLQLGQVMMACENIYSRCVVKSTVGRKVKTGDLTETEILCEKLDLIKEYVNDLAYIVANRTVKDPATPKRDAPAAATATSARGQLTTTASAANASTSRSGGKAAAGQSRQSMSSVSDRGDA